MLHDLSDCKISSCSTPFNHYFRWLKSTVKITISWYKLPVSHEELMLVVSIASSAPSSLVSRRSALATAAALGFGGANVPEVPRRCRVKKNGNIYMGRIFTSIYLYIYIYIYGGIMMYNVGKTRIYHLFMVIWGVVYSCFTHINDVCIVYTV